MHLFGKDWRSTFAQDQQRARAAAHSAWASNCEELLDRYLDNDSSMDDLRRRLRRLYPNNADQMTQNLLTVNLLRKVVDTKAKLYRIPPKRMLLDAERSPLPEDHPAQAVSRRLLRQCRLNARMKWALRLYELLNCSVLWVQIDFRRHCPVISVLPPHQLIVEQSGTDPTNLQEADSIMIPLGDKPDSPLSGGTAVGYVRYRLQPKPKGGRRLHVERLDENFVPLTTQPAEWSAYNGMDRYPFVLLRKDEPVGAELFPDVPHSLLHAAHWLDHELTRGAMNSRQTDFPAYVFNGSSEELGTANPATGAGAIICLGDDDKRLTPLAVQAREAERNQNLLFFLKLFAQSNEIIPSAFTFDVELLSGVAKFHDKQPEIEYRQDLIDRLLPIEEEDLWPILRELALLGDFDGASDLKDTHLSVTFPEQVIPLSKEEELKNLEREISLGLRSPVEILSERLGIDQEQARELYSRHREDSMLASTP